MTDARSVSYKSRSSKTKTINYIKFSTTTNEQCMAS